MRYLEAAIKNLQEAGENGWHDFTGKVGREYGGRGRYFVRVSGYRGKWHRVFVKAWTSDPKKARAFYDALMPVISRMNQGRGEKGGSFISIREKRMFTGRDWY